MKHTLSVLMLLLSLPMLLMVSASLAQIAPVPPYMSFSARLTKPDGSPVADGNYTLRLSLWSAATGGIERWNQTFNSISVRGGNFAVLLNTNTPGLFHNDLWLEIKVGNDTPLTPRQPLATVAYAFKAGSVADGSITGASLANGTLTAEKFAPNLFNTTAWLLGGNSGVTSGFLGTTDNNPLEFRVNSYRALQLQYAESNGLRGVNVLGGSAVNAISPGILGATLVGGGFDSILGTDYPNLVSASYGTIVGGIANTVSGYIAVVVGGTTNTASEQLATVGGGALNTASGQSATVAGGYQNTASGNNSTVVGGFLNAASNESATILGGSRNIAAGTYSLAGGYRARANHDGTFVWADSTAAPFDSTGIQQFLIRASGGVGINTNDPAGNALNVAGTAQMTGFKLPTGAAAGRVLLSDASGMGTWGQIGSSGLSSNTFVNPTNYNLWGLYGNSAVESGFLGTLDTYPLELRTNNRRAMRYTHAANGIYEFTGINILGGAQVNTISPGVIGATIAGGGQDNNIGDDAPNRVLANFGTVSGGSGNTAGNTRATVAGGFGNNASGESAAIGGGVNNTAGALYATVAGGLQNVAGSAYASVGGGNLNTANGLYAAIPGGANNAANGNFSFAAGLQAKALHTGAFVWADSAGGDFASTASNQFLIRASGGVGIGRNNPQQSLHTTGNIRADGGEFQGWGGLTLHPDVDNTGDDIVRTVDSAGNETMRVDFNGNVGIGTNAPAYKLHVNGQVAGVGSYVNVSDARYKQHIVTFPDALDTILNLRGVTFDWKQKEFPDMDFTPGKQIGFIAQEVEKVLPELVTTDQNGYKSVAYANIVPVLVEAVKTLKKENDTKSKRIADVEAKNAELEARLERLETALQQKQK